MVYAACHKATPVSHLLFENPTCELHHVWSKPDRDPLKPDRGTDTSVSDFLFDLCAHQLLLFGWTKKGGPARKDNLHTTGYENTTINLLLLGCAFLSESSRVCPALT